MLHFSLQCLFNFESRYSRQNQKVGVLGLGTLYGWLGFICDNGLKEGDICIFEPSKGTRRVTLIFHPLEETHHPKSSGLYVEHLK
jgi:hypothetical protein